MEADFEPRIPQSTVGVDGGLAPVATVHLPIDSLVGGLDADFDFGAAQIQHPVDLLGVTPVRLRLEGGADISDLVGLVFGDHVFEVFELVTLWVLGEADALSGFGVAIEVVVVHRFERTLDEPLLIVVTPSGHRPTHQDEFDFVDRVADRPELVESERDLAVGVVIVLDAAGGRGFVAGVALGGVELAGGAAGTVETLAVGTHMRRGHDGDRRDARGRPDRLALDDRFDRLAVFGRGGFEEFGVFRDLGRGVLRADAELGGFEIVATDLAVDDLFDERCAGLFERVGFGDALGAHVDTSRGAVVIVPCHAVSRLSVSLVGARTLVAVGIERLLLWQLTERTVSCRVRPASADRSRVPET